MFDEKRLDLLIKLGSYQLNYVLIRMLLVSLIAVGIFYFSELFVENEFLLKANRLQIYLIGVLAFNSLSEISLFVMKLLIKSEKLRYNIYLQILIVVSLSVIIAIFWISIVQRIVGNDELIFNKATQIAIFAGTAFIIIHVLVTIISNLLKEWMDNRKELNSLKQAKMLSDYNLLKDRLNPHFLFNNLSVLKSLIRYNPQSAEIFTQNFTNVYRYVLNSQEIKTVPLKEELKFLASYIALHKERIGEGLTVNIDISDSELQKSIPPMSLQLLVENAIKHNVANKLHPLQIDIYSESDNLIVKNNLNKKETTYSTKTGLQSLVQQYQLLADLEVEVISNEGFFSVKLPLI